MQELKFYLQTVNIGLMVELWHFLEIFFFVLLNN